VPGASGGYGRGTIEGVNRLGIVRCTVAAALFGASAPAASRLADDVGAFTLAGLLYLGAALAVAPVVARQPRERRAWDRGGARLAVAVIAGGGAGPVLLAAGLARTPAATASLLLNLELVATVLLAAAFFSEHIGGRVAAGTVLVVAAGVTLGWSPSADLRLGALFIAAACTCWGLDNCVTAALDELTPAQITLAKGTIAGSVNLAIGLATGAAPSAGQAAAALVVGAVGYGVSITLWVAGARLLGAARGQLVFATAPFLGAVVAWLVLSEPVTGAQVIATLLAGAGVAFVVGSDHTHAHRHHPVEHDHEHRHDDGHHRHTHAGGFTGRHQHSHQHAPLVHAHPHVPDLHHRHDHS